MEDKGIPRFTLLIILAGILILAAVFYFTNKNSSQNQQDQIIQPTGEIAPITGDYSISSTNAGTKTAPKASPQIKPLTYTEAVNLYKDKRIQFASNCQVIPNFVTFKNSTKVMFDNRTPQSLSFSLDGQKYPLSAYGFKIITLYNKNLPHTVRLNCGSGVNNGQILLQ